MEILPMGAGSVANLAALVTGIRNRPDIVPLITALVSDTTDLQSVVFDIAEEILRLPPIAGDSIGVFNYDAARTAALGGDVVKALVHLELAFGANPLYTAHAASDPALEHLQAEAGSIANRLAVTARFQAESQIEAAAHALGEAVLVKPNQDLREPELLLLSARAFLNTGLYLGYFNAAQAAQRSLTITRNTLANGTPGPGVAARQGWAGKGAKPVPGQILCKFHKLWRRLPLLALLIAWFFLGLACGFLGFIVRIIIPEAAGSVWYSTIYSTWGLGLLVLAAIGAMGGIRKSVKR